MRQKSFDIERRIHRDSGARFVSTPFAGTSKLRPQLAAIPAGESRLLDTSPHESASRKSVRDFARRA
ncbi:hypothetical protein ATY76_04655 [Rhizobium sp. R339]|uniref:hypothetical protein n=1 Tax=Rhizobium sp. R339 TaxID=1764273 RepID=UPI000B537396|nr:hypothetical protein [Rhizobium sp. R339]OWV77232.1 hypothetical protein ATY76_04655 [Rhizobium sp. R339]